MVGQIRLFYHKAIFIWCSIVKKTCSLTDGRLIPGRKKHSLLSSWPLVDKTENCFTASCIPKPFKKQKQKIQFCHCIVFQWMPAQLSPRHTQWENIKANSAIYWIAGIGIQVFCRLSVGLGVFITEGVKFIISKMACHFHKLHTHATFTDGWKKEKNYNRHIGETLLFACIFLLERYFKAMGSMWAG